MGTLQVASAIVLIGAALAVLFNLARGAFGFFEKLRQFLDDWNGEPERPGIAPKRFGVMERLTIVEAAVKNVEHEVKPNSGTSLKDQITRIEEHSVPADARPS